MSTSNSTTTYSKISFEGVASGLILCAIAAFNIWTLLPFPYDEGLFHTDFAFHLSILRALDETVRSGGNFLDFWYDESPFGFALFRSYQNLPYLFTYLLHRLTPQVVTLDVALRLSLIILGLLFPLSIWWSLRKLGFRSLDAAVAGVAGSLISEADNFGLGLQNYTFGTGGMITQLWAVVVLGPALACGVTYLNSGKNFISAVALIAFCFGSHVLCAFIIFFSLAAFTLISSLSSLSSTMRRSFFLGITLLVITSYQWLFVLLDGPYINQSIVEPRYKFASHGLDWVVEKFITGELFDTNRIPILSAIVIFGFISALSALKIFVSKCEQKAPLSCEIVCWIAISFLLSLSLLVGWEIWGFIFQNAPVLRSLHMHRFIIAVNFFGIVLVGYGFSVARSLLPQRVSIQLLALLALAYLLVPVMNERLATHRTAHGWRQSASQALRNDADLAALIAKAQSLPRTYIHPGMHQTWSDRLSIAGMVPLHNYLLARGFPVMGGMLFHAFSLAGDTMFTFSSTKEASYDLFGVGSVVAPSDWMPPPFLNPIGSFGRYKLLQSRSKRLQFVTPTFALLKKNAGAPRFMQRWTASQLSDLSQVGVLLQSEEAPPSNLPVIDYNSEVPAIALLKNNHSTQTISESTWRRDKITATVTSTSDSHLMMKTGYHPNWRAFVDDIEVKPLWITPGFLAIPVSQGKHEVRFQYYGSALKIVLFSLSLPLLGVLSILRKQHQFFQ